MSLEFIGLIGPQEGSESQAPRGPDVDLEFIKAFAQAQEYGGFDKALLAVATDSALWRTCSTTSPRLSRMALKALSSAPISSLPPCGTVSARSP